MHPILARGGRLALYLGLWTAVGVLLAVLLVAQTGFGWKQAALVALPLALLYAFVCLSAWYVSRGMPLAATGAVRIIATALSASAISSAMWLFAARTWVDWLARRGLVPALGGTSGLYAFFSGFGLLLYLLSLAISYLIAVLEHTRAAERRALQVQVLAREAELRMLRAQIDPHFLFNSLHSISALTGSDPASARRMCVLLADFLRESLALGAENRITLVRELELVARFLAVERVRYGDRLRDEIVVTDDADRCLVPPLLLLPLVENAVTHGVAHMLSGGTVKVTAGRNGSRLHVTVENPCDPDRPRRGGAGVGLANVRARLTTLHGQDARFAAGETDGFWRVEFVIPGESRSETGAG
jgi:two-component system sensor histidine kinase AlgZ